MLGLVSAVRCFGFGARVVLGVLVRWVLLRVFLVLDRWVVCVNCVGSCLVVLVGV